jgi:peptidoglycan/LPS O-acetylase OafA/YrhL
MSGYRGGGLLRERSLTIDASRGVAIILVVLGHSIMVAIDYYARDSASLPRLLVNLDQVIYAFHMPLFVVLAGYVTWRPETKSTRQFLVGRFRRLMVPYLSWLLGRSLVLLAISHRLGVRGLAAALVNPWSGGLWFFYALFLCYVILAPLRRSPRLVATSAIVVACLPHLGGIMPWTPGQLVGLTDSWVRVATVGGGLLDWRDVLWLYPFLAVGFLAAAYSEKAREHRRLIVSASAVVFPVLVAATWPIGFGSGGMGPWLHGLVGPRFAGLADYALVLLRYPLALAGTVLCVALVSTLGRAAKGALAFVGTRSLGIFAIQAQVVNLGWGTGAIGVVRVFLATFGLSLGGTMVLERIPVVADLLLGQPARRLHQREM